MFSIIRGFVDIHCSRPSLINVTDSESVHTRSRNLRLYQEQCNEYLYFALHGSTIKHTVLQ